MQTSELPSVFLHQERKLSGSVLGALVHERHVGGIANTAFFPPTFVFRTVITKMSPVDVFLTEFWNEE